MWRRFGKWLLTTFAPILVREAAKQLEGKGGRDVH